jgi:hypothetical protein
MVEARPRIAKPRCLIRKSGPRLAEKIMRDQRLRPDDDSSRLRRSEVYRPVRPHYKPPARWPLSFSEGAARDAQVAQLVEHATENRSVGGSIPPLGTIEKVHLFAVLLLEQIPSGKQPVSAVREPDPLTVQICDLSRAEPRSYFSTIVVSLILGIL